MGFKCPVCLKDFGRDKKEWSKHIQSSHDGAGKDMVACLKKIAEVDIDERLRDSQ